MLLVQQSSSVLRTVLLILSHEELEPSSQSNGPHMVANLHSPLSGRVWFFYEADPGERRLTDTYIMLRLHELATECHEYRDEQGTINFTLGCILGNLSGQVFPLTQEEHECIREEDRRFLAEYEAPKAGTSQEQDTEPLRIAMLQEA